MEDSAEYYGGFTKVFGHRSLTSWIHRSTDLELRGVWDDLLKLADRKGLVRGDYPAIAMAMNRPLDMVISKMSILSAAHPESRSQVARGASVVQIELGVWLIVNYERYRGARDVEKRRAYKAQKMREYRAREREKESVDKVDSVDKAWTNCGQRGQSVDTPSEVKCGQSVDQRGPIQIQNKSTPQTPQRGAGFTKPLALVFPEEEKKEDEEPSGWTDELRKAAKLQFPEAALPEKFRALPVDIQRSIAAMAKKIRG
jgi:hypothetical protein